MKNKAYLNLLHTERLLGWVGCVEFLEVCLGVGRRRRQFK